MTTREAEARYLQENLSQHNGRRAAVHNPHDKSLEELPVIYGFNNGGGTGFMMAVSVAEDGTVLGNHCCSNEGYMPADLGILEGTRPDRHANDYQKHYPDGYRMEFVPSHAIESHEGLQSAFAKNKQNDAAT